MVRNNSTVLYIAYMQWLITQIIQLDEQSNVRIMVRVRLIIKNNFNSNIAAKSIYSKQT